MRRFPRQDLWQKDIIFSPFLPPLVQWHLYGATLTVPPYQRDLQPDLSTSSYSCVQNKHINTTVGTLRTPTAFLVAINSTVVFVHTAQIHTDVDNFITAEYAQNFSNGVLGCPLFSFILQVVLFFKRLRPVPRDITKIHSGHSQTWPWSKRTQSDVFVLPKGISTLGPDWCSFQRTV